MAGLCPCDSLEENHTQLKFATRLNPTLRANINNLIDKAHKEIKSDRRIMQKASKSSIGAGARSHLLMEQVDAQQHIGSRRRQASQDVINPLPIDSPLVLIHESRKN